MSQPAKRALREAPIEAPEAPAPAAPPPPPSAPPEPLTLVGAPCKADPKRPAVPGTIEHWCIAKRWPTWLRAGMEAGKHVNQEFTEAEIEKLARDVAGLPLGRG